MANLSNVSEVIIGSVTLTDIVSATVSPTTIEKQDTYYSARIPKRTYGNVTLPTYTIVTADVNACKLYDGKKETTFSIKYKGEGSAVSAEGTVTDAQVVAVACTSVEIEGGVEFSADNGSKSPSTFTVTVKCLAIPTFTWASGT